MRSIEIVYRRVEKGTDMAENVAASGSVILGRRELAVTGSIHNSPIGGLA
jgi:hypothetical protein